MREIKFRAWDIDLKQMRVCNDLYFFEENHIYNTDDNGWAIIQFTGLKDKNSKEIYEGDIVRLESVGYYKENYLICFGEYDDEGAEYETKGYGWYGRRIMKSKKLAKKWDIHLIYHYLDYVEVIGNIYENPELLK